MNAQALRGHLQCSVSVPKPVGRFKSLAGHVPGHTRSRHRVAVTGRKGIKPMEQHLEYAAQVALMSKSFYLQERTSRHESEPSRIPRLGWEMQCRRPTYSEWFAWISGPSIHYTKKPTHATVRTRTVVIDLPGRSSLPTPQHQNNFALGLPFDAGQPTKTPHLQAPCPNILATSTATPAQPRRLEYTL